MQYFTEQAMSHREVLEKIRLKYGDDARILSKKTIRMGGFLGMFSREGVEMSGYITQTGERRKSLDIDEEKRKILESVKKESSLNVVLQEIKELKESLQNNGNRNNEEHKSISSIREILEKNDFTKRYIDRIVENIKKSFSLEELDDFNMIQNSVAEMIAENISFYSASHSGSPAIFVLIGPTGVGKTTTIAKLAAMHGITPPQGDPVQVRMLTADNYRIGAKKQIETYGEIMNIPVASIETAQDLKKKVALFQEADLIFVDTVGKSPKDYIKLGEMRELFETVNGSASFHLAISATTKTTDLYEILQQFEPFNYSSVIVTKLDETIHIGNILSVLYEKNKPISYITDGQGVPQDIEKASANRLAKHLSGLKYDHEKMERKYG